MKENKIEKKSEEGHSKRIKIFKKSILTGNQKDMK
jgi:hypothetical protein